MRTAWRIKMVLACVGLMAGWGGAPALWGASASPSNLLDGRCFTAGETGAWRGVQAQTALVPLDQPTNGCAYALRAVGAKPRGRVIYQADFFLRDATLHKLTFLYRLTGQKKARVKLRVGDRDYACDLIPQPTWTPVTMDVAVPPGNQGGGILEFQLPGGCRAELWLTDVALTPCGDLEYLAAAQWAARRADSLRHSGWTMNETASSYVFSRGLISEYYAKTNAEYHCREWEAKCFLGKETQRQAFHFSRVPLGYYVYLNMLVPGAKQRGVPWRELAETVFDRLEQNHVSAILVGNTYLPEEDGKTLLDGLSYILDLAQKHGIEVILQYSPTYFRVKTMLKETSAAWPKALLEAQKAFDALDDHPALLAWSFKEEVSLGQAEGLERYYREIRRRRFHKPVYQCNNNLNAARYPFNPCPDIWVFDTYCFKYIPYLGRSRTPAMSYATQFERVSNMHQAAVPSGAPLIHCGLTAANHCYRMPADKIIPDPRHGWLEDPAGGWNGSVYYYAPTNGGMRGQVWLGLAAGTKGFLGWFYTYPATGQAGELKPSDSYCANVFSVACDRNGRETPQFAELGATFAEIQPLAPFILNMTRRVLPAATTVTPEVFVTTHAMENGGETIIMPVNCLVAREKTNETWKVDWATGQMTGFAAAAPQEIELKLEQSGALYDLKRNRDVPVSNGTARVILEPGEGTLLLLGDAAGAAAIRERVEKRTGKK